MFEKKLEAGRHILTGKPIPLMRDGEEISGGYARWARAGRHSSSRPEGLFVYSGHCVGNGYGLLDGVRIYPDTQGPASSLECGGWRNRLETAVLNTFFLMTANAAAM